MMPRGVVGAGNPGASPASGRAGYVRGRSQRIRRARLAHPGRTLHSFPFRYTRLAHGQVCVGAERRDEKHVGQSRHARFRAENEGACRSRDGIECLFSIERYTAQSLESAKVAEQADALVLGASGATRGGSNPPFRTNSAREGDRPGEWRDRRAGRGDARMDPEPNTTVRIVRSAILGMVRERSRRSPPSGSWIWSSSSTEWLLISPRSRFMQEDAWLLLLATIFVPAAGGLIVGIAHRYIPEHRALGPSDVIRAVQGPDGRVPLRSGFLSRPDEPGVPRCRGVGRPVRSAHPSRGDLRIAGRPAEPVRRNDGHHLGGAAGSRPRSRLRSTRPSQASSSPTK